MVGTLTPNLVKSNGGSLQLRPSGLGTLVGVGTWSKNPPCSS